MSAIDFEALARKLCCPESYAHIDDDSNELCLDGWVMLTEVEAEWISSVWADRNAGR